MPPLTDAQIIQALKTENESLEQELASREGVVRTSWFVLALAVIIITVESLALIFLSIKE